MQKLKVEFLLPLRYNDGTYIEPEKFFNVKEKVLAIFGGLTINPVPSEGIWIDPNTSIKYIDECRRFEVSVEKTPNILKILTDFKKELKEMFQQEEIYMYYTEITLV